MPLAPARAGEIWLGDLVRAASRLHADADALREIAALLALPLEGPAGRPDTQGRPPVAVPPVAPPGGGPGPAPAPPAPPAAAAESGPVMASRRLPLRAERLPAGPQAPPPDWLAGTPPLAADVAAPVRTADPLLPPLRRRAVLAAALATEVEDGPPDVPRLVRVLASGLPPRRLPRQRRPSLRHGAHVRIDRAEWLQPHFADQQQLLDYLRRLLPPGRLQLSWLDGGPMPPARRAVGVPPRRHARPRVAAPRPASAAPVLLLTDFGAGWHWQGRAPAPLAAWRQFVQLVHRQGRPVIALVPRAPVGAAAIPGLSLLPWSERCSVGQVRRIRRGTRGTAPAVADEASLDRLVEWLSPALRITPWLLRAARRRLGLDVAAEAALAADPRVQSSGAGVLVLDAQAAHAARERLAAGPDRDAALALVRAARGDARDGTALEEALIALELTGAVDEDSVAAVLRPALRALADASDSAAAIAGWAAHAWTRFGPAVRQTLAARQLAYAAARHLRTRGWLAAGGGRPPPLPPDSGWLFAPDTLDVAPWSVELRRFDDGSSNLVVGPAAPATTAHHRLALPALQPLWLELDDGRSGAPQTLLLEPGAQVQLELEAPEPGQAIELRPLVGDAWRLRVPATAAEAVAAALVRVQREDGSEAAPGLLLSRDLVLMPVGNAAPGEAPLSSWADGERAMLAGIGVPAVLGAQVLGFLNARDGLVHVLRLDRPLDSDAAAWAPLDLEATTSLPAGEGFFVPLHAPEAAATPTREQAGSVPGHDPAQGPGLYIDDVGRWRLAWEPSAGVPRSKAARSRGASRRGATLDSPLLQSLLHDAMQLARAHWRGLLLPLPEALKEGYALRDMLRASVGPMHLAGADDEGTLVDDPAALQDRLDRSDRVVLVGRAPPDAALARALQQVLATGLPLAWVPLAEDPQRVLDAWPAQHAALSEALRARQLLTGQDLGAIARQLAAGDITSTDAAAPEAAEGADAAVPASAPRRSWGASLRRRLADLLESRVADPAQRGLMQVRLDDEATTLQRIDEGLAVEGEGGPPWLLFVHGEASDTLGSFGALLSDASPARERLREAYAGRVLAWQHRSVTVGPVANTVALLQALPPGIELHLVTLGAGGLVGELIARGMRVDGQPAFTADELSALASGALPDGAEPGLAEALGTLSQLLQRRRGLRLGRFVRVACPAAGTPIYAAGPSRLRSLAGVLPGIGTALGLIPGVDRLLSDPQASPGLAGLLPGGGVQRWLTPEVTTHAPLAVVAGVAAPGGWMGRLARMGQSLLTGAEAQGDGVVSVASALGGLERAAGVDLLIDDGPDVGHFRYFHNPRTRDAIVQALLSSTAPPPFERTGSLRELQQRHGGRAMAA